ncbi:ABC transporter permease [Myroides odoratus]|uniref:ABC-2 family transporter protein n=1 Tax=Myroides odoratus TaxID=256 RepID=A0A378RMH5_MYROD|nr:ABC transporter permease [Myroides odoratus]QQU04336.1 ABC transporter permease [Myroides odoratus]STZ28242.1 ABC-2 family transporter protein [Myroides odoratus]
MGVLKLIIKREFIAKARNKAFIVMTFLAPLFFVAIAVLIGYLSTMKSTTKVIAIHDESGIFSGDFENSEEYEYQNLSAVPIAILKDSVLAEKYDGLLYIPKQEQMTAYENSIYYISNESPGIAFISKIESTIENKVSSLNLIEKGIDPKIIKENQAEVNLHLEKASGEQTVKGLNEIKIFIGSLFGYCIMMFIIIYGNMVMRSVIEEKTNRIIEVIISSVKPFQLMMGKIIGTSMAGLLQFLIWGVVGGILMLVATSVFGLNAGSAANMEAAQMATTMDPSMMSNIQNYITEIMSLPLLSWFVYFIIFFIGGYFLYSSLYAAIGAAVDNETDTQQFLFPVMLPLMLGVYIGFFTVIKDPHGTVATVFSMIPFTSPIVMLMRIPFGVPIWQIIVSIVLLFATFILTVWLAAKIYRIGILMYGKRPSWKELYKWLKY